MPNKRTEHEREAGRPGDDRPRGMHGDGGAAIYTCPMHPEVRQDKPGKCPRCGMDLVPKTDGKTGNGHQHGQTGAPAGHGAMPEMIREMRRPWLWTNFTVAALGLWLIAGAATFGYREPRMVASDLVSGALLIVLPLLALRPRLDFWGRWGAALVGSWLQFAPLVFWAKQPAAYLNDTLVGAIAVTLTILVPMMPGMAHHMAMMKPGPEIPPGWTYNPSTWVQRFPMIVLAFVGWLISRHLAAVQLGYIPAAWEPFFGPGTDRVLHSSVSQMWPVSDAGLGAAAYTFEALMGCMGGQTRWRSMPWMVLLFGILVVPLGVVSIVLVILQPLAVGAWCMLCLATAAVMLAMIPLALDEVVAMVQFMVLAKREGKPLWRTFWVGDTVSGGGKDDRTPRYGEPVWGGRGILGAAVWGVRVPWTLAASMALGLWVMFAPAALGSAGAAADSDHLVGPLAVVIAVIAAAEVARPLRFVNMALGAWLIVGPWFLHGATAGARWNDLAVGLALVALSLPRGMIQERYGSWDRYVF